MLQTLLEKMVRPEGETSNTEDVSDALFETLEDWSNYLEKEGLSVDETDRSRPVRPMRGPSP